MAALGFFSRRSSTHWATLSASATSVRLKTMVPALSIWLLKNSPKFFIYILHFCASTTVTEPFKVTSISPATSQTAFITSESFPTPDGSMITRSGAYFVSTSFKERPKSPTREQQIQPEFISRISMPESCKNPPSIPISPNSFSIRTTFSPAMASSRSFLINVVFPAPKNPEIISIFVILTPFLPYCRDKYLPLPVTNFSTISRKVKSRRRLRKRRPGSSQPFSNTRARRLPASVQARSPAGVRVSPAPAASGCAGRHTPCLSPPPPARAGFPPASRSGIPDGRRPALPAP